VRLLFRISHSMHARARVFRKQTHARICIICNCRAVHHTSIAILCYALFRVIASCSKDAICSSIISINEYRWQCIKSHQSSRVALIILRDDTPILDVYSDFLFHRPGHFSVTDSISLAIVMDRVMHAIYRNLRPHAMSRALVFLIKKRIDSDSASAYD